MNNVNNYLALVFFVYNFAFSSSSGESAFHNNTVSENIEFFDHFQGDILCRSCGNEVVASNDLISKLSPHSIYYFKDSLFGKNEVLVQVLPGVFILNNPVILSSAANCVGNQEWEEGESWFPGYHWKPCICPDCGEYIGWIFEPINSDFVETSQFFGLILSSLIGESCKYFLIRYGLDFALCDCFALRFKTLFWV